MPSRKVIECGVLIDGTSDEPISNARVVVDGERFSEVGPRDVVSVPDGARRIDHSEEFVVPGLIDAHVHLMGERTYENHRRFLERTDRPLSAARATADLREALAAGFTTVRDMASTTGIALGRAVADGEIPGPRIYSAGQSLTQTGGKGDETDYPVEWMTSEVPVRDRLVDGADECRKETRKRIRDGADLIKIFASGGTVSRDRPSQKQFTAEEIRAITQEAHRVDIPVAAHAQGGEAVKNCLRNGVDTIEHGDGLDREGVELFEENDGTLVSTLLISKQFVTKGADHGVPGYAMDKTSGDKQQRRVEAIRLAYESGVPVALGTDTNGPELMAFGNNAAEAELYVEQVGMTEMDAIKAGTSVAARTVPDDDVGSVEPGNRADLVALGSDPLEDISALFDVQSVYKNGQKQTV